jgi:hypothetical protein
MNAIRAVVRNGRLETEQPLDLPEGTEVVISLAAIGLDEGEAWDNSPEAITAWLQWCDSLQPLIFTEEELGALKADRQARKEWEKAHFEEYAEQVRRLWE